MRLNTSSIHADEQQKNSLFSSLSLSSIPERREQMKLSSEEKRMEPLKSEKDRLSAILANNHRCESQIEGKKNRAKLSGCITREMIDFNL